MVDAQRISSQLIALAPPNPPTDLIASALFLPLHSINPSHHGKKLRFIGQVLAFHPPTSLLLLTSFPPITQPHSPSPTILINITTPLLGQSPSLKDMSTPIQTVNSTHPGFVNRESLSLNRGEWVNIVGWLEGDGQKMVRKVKTSSSYLKPLPFILEAIHVSNARPPPLDAMYRGNTPAWNGTRSINSKDVILIDDKEEMDDEVVEITPRPKRKPIKALVT
ncbi:uncharacterized protein I206_105832 [Kwoniella pini CBS 10737]|uniref:Uncharacterized protein n=1 Tax=Kwoniella pini CBS 10737 TaxID=1296096 RepID=A0A1B9I0B7_9TREE|nr:uncharacterized protein I206_04652 [Kwoniella pini CBS 10737]OCF48965.1 hypothetical protein I206_04652 [Kwoniella pini CBS 10737]